MGLHWSGGEENGFPLFFGPSVYISHGDAVSVVVEAVWNLPARCWSHHDLRRLEAAAKELRRRFEEGRAPGDG